MKQKEKNDEGRNKTNKTNTHIQTCKSTFKMKISKKEKIKTKKKNQIRENKR